MEVDMTIDDMRNDMKVQSNGTVYVGNKYAGETVNVAIEVVEE